MQLVLWQVKRKMKGLHLLHYVKAHQDNYKKYSDLLLEVEAQATVVT